MSEAARDLAMSRFRLIQPYLEERRSLQLVAADAKSILSDCPKVGKPVPEARTGCVRAQST